MLIFSKELLFAAGDLHGVIEFTQPGIHTFKLLRRTQVKLTQVGSGQDSYKYIWDKIMASGTETTYYSGSGGAVFIGGVILPAGTYTVTINQSTEYANPNASSDSSTFAPRPGSTLASDQSVILRNQNSVLLTTSSYLTEDTNLDIVRGTVEAELGGNLGSGGTSSTTGAYAGGASQYNGYGKGADSRRHNATTGYFKIEW